MFAPTLNIGSEVLWLIYGVSGVAAITLSSMLYYHWRTYSQNNQKISRSRLLYTAGLVVFLALPLLILMRLN